MKRKIPGFFIIGFLSIFLIAPSLVFPQGAPIKIGFLAPITGGIPQTGKDMVDGANLYLDEIGFKMAGRKVDFMIEDDENTPAAAMTKARKLVEMNRIHILTGTVLASSGYALAPYVDSKRVPTAFMCVPSDDLTQRKRPKWVVRVGWNDSQVSHPFGEHAYKVMGYRKIATIGMDYAFGWEVLGGFQRTFEEAGGKIIQKLWVPMNAQDLSPYIAQVNRDADAIFAILFGKFAVMFHKQYKDYGMTGKIPLIGIGHFTDPTVLPSLGDEALGVITALHYNPWMDTPINKEFVQKFKNKYGKIPSYFAENCYTGMKWIDEAMTSLKGEVENPEKVLKALQSVRLKETPRGPISVDAFGNPVQNVYIMKVERVGGELQNKVIHTYPRVSQFWKYEPQDYLKLPLYSRDYPPLKP